MAPTYYHHDHDHDQNSYNQDSDSYSDSDSIDTEIGIGHYSNLQKILLVGEGDFSFASCLAKSFHSASNLTATSLDARETVIRNYWEGKNNLLNLEERDAVVLHQVDAHEMDQHYELRRQLFDRIVFNFPHSGGHYVNESDPNCIRYMLTENGEVHVTHKTSHPFNKWNIVDLAEEAGLMLTREAMFDKWDYPEYVYRKGYGYKWNTTFPIGDASTFMFSCKI